MCIHLQWRDVLQGVIADLRLRGDPRAAEHQCEEEEDDAEVSTERLQPGGLLLGSWAEALCLSPAECRHLEILAAGQRTGIIPQGRIR